jgi:hypothetical protein
MEWYHVGEIVLGTMFVVLLIVLVLTLLGLFDPFFFLDRVN